MQGSLSTPNVLVPVHRAKSRLPSTAKARALPPDRQAERNEPKVIVRSKRQSDRTPTSKGSNHATPVTGGGWVGLHTVEAHCFDELPTFTVPSPTRDPSSYASPSPSPSPKAVTRSELSKSMSDGAYAICAAGIGGTCRPEERLGGPNTTCTVELGHGREVCGGAFLALTRHGVLQPPGI